MISTHNQDIEAATYIFIIVTMYNYKNEIERKKQQHAHRGKCIRLNTVSDAGKTAEILENDQLWMCESPDSP